MALKCSETMHTNKRVGEGGGHIFVSDGIDTIDASQIERPPWYSVSSYFPCNGSGHSYYVDNVSVQEDMHELMMYNSDPSLRHGLEEVPGSRYWIFRTTR